MLMDGFVNTAITIDATTRVTAPGTGLMVALTP
jgi:hypothetical protein